MTDRPWIPLVLVVLAAIFTPVLADADLVCPTCDPESFGAAEIVDLVVSTLLSQGISILVVGAAAVVGIPWVIAGVAVAVLYLPRRFKASS